MLNSRFDDFMCLIGLVCSSYVAVSSGTHYRAPWSPLGRTHIPFVQMGNQMTSRSLAWVEHSLACLSPWNPKVFSSGIQSARFFLGPKASKAWQEQVNHTQTSLNIRNMFFCSNPWDWPSHCDAQQLLIQHVRSNLCCGNSFVVCDAFMLEPFHFARIKKA